MGRVVALPTVLKRAKPRWLQRGHPWNASLPVYGGAMRTPNGEVVSCDGRILVGFRDDDTWEITFAVPDSGLGRSISGDVDSPEGDVVREFLALLFGTPPIAVAGDSDAGGKS